MFSDVEADIYVLVDGDATYDASSVRRLIGRLLEKRLDMVVASRANGERAAYRVGHRTGNKLLTAFVASVFGSKLNDMLSGYRVFVAQICEVISGIVERIRNRNRTYYPCSRTGSSGRGS